MEVKQPMRNNLKREEKGGNTSANLGSSAFLQRKTLTTRKKNHGMNNKFRQSKPLPMKFFRVGSCFSLFKKVHSALSEDG
jgi:hypothetical protein